MAELADAPDSKSGSERSVGSTPTARTSLRAYGASARRASGREGCRAEARRAEADRARNAEWGLRYVYLLESVGDAEHFYVGVTSDLRARLKKHNNREVTHTSKFAPWRIKIYVAFSDEAKAVQFERYLKSGSGRAFAKKRF